MKIPQILPQMPQKQRNKTGIIRYKKISKTFTHPLIPRLFNVLEISLHYYYNVLRGIRTPDRRLRRPLLYPAELSGQMALSFQQPNTILCLNRLFVNGFL